MNKQRVFDQLCIDEGVKYEIYHDHLGYPTFGVGHLIVKDDPEYGCEVGTLFLKSVCGKHLRKTCTLLSVSASHCITTDFYYGLQKYRKY